MEAQEEPTPQTVVARAAVRAAAETLMAQAVIPWGRQEVLRREELPSMGSSWRRRTVPMVPLVLVRAVWQRAVLEAGEAAVVPGPGRLVEVCTSGSNGSDLDRPMRAGRG